MKLNDLINDHGGTMRRGSGWVEWTDEVSVAEALFSSVSSILEARQRGSQTTICPSRGMWVSWANAAAEAAFEALVAEALAEYERLRDSSRDEDSRVESMWRHIEAWGTARPTP